ncbi:MAG: hypothetical protein HKN13_13425 [Rhodothermales bacterium]|nr:hypothetical protein [Rhodothermales bacterium]
MDIRLETAEVGVSGDWARETGSWTFHIPTGEQMGHGWYMCVLHKTDDVWKIHRDIWSSVKPDDDGDGHDEEM